MAISRQLYTDLNFVSSQQTLLLFQKAQIPVDFHKYPVFAIHSSVNTHNEIPQGLWPPFLRENQKVYEGAKNIIHHMMDLEELQSLRSKPTEDGRAQKMMNKALDLEDHLFLIEGEFFYGFHMKKLQNQVDSILQGFRHSSKSNLLELVISRKIPVPLLASSLREVDKALKALDEHLSYQIAIQGNIMGLADLVWLPLLDRLVFLGWPLKKHYKEVYYWYQEALKTFPEFQTVKNLEKLPAKGLYPWIQKISWIGGRNLYSTLKLNQII